MDIKEKRITCSIEMVSDFEGIAIPYNQLINYIIIDGKLNRKIYINEYLAGDFEIVEYGNNMNSLTNDYLLGEDCKIYDGSLIPYLEDDKIVYPHTINDYTDLSAYSEKEVPYEVRTEDGKAIDFELYWEYINNRNLLDGFTCTLERDE